ncbi:phosphotransferase [Phocaeicola coprophilus]|uniref:RapZ C-terminal domain-containing protein n=1 Tax=Phocaeicola coprophilus TaxID=387090 RepID=UPI003AB76235
MNTDILETLYKTFTGKAPEAIEPLPGAGSNRRYFRLKGEQTLIGVIGTSVEENRTFLYMASHFHHKGLPVPRVFAVSDDQNAYLQEDLGNTQLFDLIKNRRGQDFDEPTLKLLTRTMQDLARFQFKGAEGMDFGKCYPQPEFNRRSALWDLNYFKYCFLKATGTEFQEDRLEDDFERMADTLAQASPRAFMYRDFQSRNVMISQESPRFIDFQGGRRGPVLYDVASFLWQAKANFPDNLRRKLAEVYRQALQAYCPMDAADFENQLRLFVLFRTLQVLGAYGFRGYFEQKPHFLESIPYAIANLQALLEEPYPEYSYLCKVLKTMAGQKQFAAAYNRRKLTVRVMSFSYRKGIPEDPSENGGGYVFDCRGVHNPGRYDRYKPLTGRDEPVIRFLEEDGEILRFLEHTDALVDAHVERYLERGFTHLQVCFGCTGGQHRSVYSAQHTAEHLHRKYGIRVELIHREQQIRETFEP